MFSQNLLEELGFGVEELGAVQQGLPFGELPMPLARSIDDILREMYGPAVIEALKPSTLYEILEGTSTTTSSASATTVTISAAAMHAAARTSYTGSTYWAYDPKTASYTLTIPPPKEPDDGF